MKADEVYISDSLIHGKGVFASRNFKRGEIVMRWDISLCLNEEDFNDLSLLEKNKILIMNGRYIVVQEPERFVNHSCEPNTECKNFCDIAIKDIKRGEEVTTNYMNDPPEIEMKCNCRSSKCRGAIGGDIGMKNI